MREWSRIMLAAGIGVWLAGWPGYGDPPALVSLGEEEPISDVYAERPSVSTDSLRQPHVVADNGGRTPFMKFHRVNGAWSGGVFAVGSPGGRYDASRLYIGQIEIDPLDRAWISCKMGTKEFGTMLGQGVWLFRDVATDPNPAEVFFRYVVVYKGMGMVATDSKYPNQGVVLGTFGNYLILNDRGESLQRGSLNAGQGGEKVRFRIASYAPRFGSGTGSEPDGVWHTCMNGFSAEDAKYQNSLRRQAGLLNVTWARYSRYPVMGDDLCHPGIGIDRSDPRVAYMGCVFYGDVCVNVWTGDRMTAPPDALHVVGTGAARETRHGPAFAPAPGAEGGSFVFWTAGGRIKMGFISREGRVADQLTVGTETLPTPVDIAPGRFPAATLDQDGHLHLVYVNGGLRYRKILISHLEPIAPRGRILGTRRPEFRWSDLGFERYTLAMDRDGELWIVTEAEGPAWQPPEDLPVGTYRWAVKSGGAEEEGTWSKSLVFRIPPATPEPMAPSNRIAEVPALPLFRIRNGNIGDRYGKCEWRLYREGDLVGNGEVAIPEEGFETLEWELPGDPLEAGRYQWQVRAVREHDDPAYTVRSPFSTALVFSVGVPDAPIIVLPESNAVFDPGRQTIEFAWSGSETATGYTVRILQNGAEWLSRATNTPALPLARRWDPARYQIWITPWNEHGAGLIAGPGHFLVRRLMRPNQPEPLAGSPAIVEWTSTRGVPGYDLRLSLYDVSLGRYRLILQTLVEAGGSAITAQWILPFDLPDGAYRWQLRDIYPDGRIGYTSTAFFQIGVPGRPTLLEPVSGSVRSGAEEHPFRWIDPSQAAVAFQMEVWAGERRLLRTGWKAAENVREDEPFVYRLPRSLTVNEPTLLRWQVRGRNDRGFGPWQSAVWTLVPLEAPRLTEPEPESVIPAETPVRYRWTVPEHAAAIEWEWQRDDEEAERGRLEGDAMDDGLERLLAEPGTYRFRVRAWAEGASPWSEPVTVYAEAPPG